MTSSAPASSFTREQYLNHMNATLDLFEKHAKHISKTNCGMSIAPGWLPIVSEMFDEIELSGCTDIRVQQIKEKFGILRFYYEGGDITLHNILTDLETSSSLTCDVCGEFGTRDGSGGWLVTRCGSHRKAIWPEMMPKDYTSYEKRLKKISKQFSAELE